MRSSVVTGILCLCVLFSGVATAQNGLYGEYFLGMRLTTLRATRIDPQVDFDWGSGAPHPNLGPDNFSVCWTGFVTPTQSGEYTFSTITDDGARLWVNNVKLVDQWVDQGPTEVTGTLTLTAGTAYPIRMEYFENGGGAVARLHWEGPGQAKGPIPSANLTPGKGLGDRYINWIRNPANGHFYRLAGPMTWAEAKGQAAAWGGYLATINDAAENAWIANTFRVAASDLFIGANDIATEGAWVWDQTGENFWNGAASGTAVPGFFVNWNENEPNDSGGNEDVATILTGTGRWNDLSATAVRYAVVESEEGKINYSGPDPLAATIVVGRRFQTKVTVRQPSAEVTYQWFKNGVEINGAVTDTLTIPDVGYVHAGLYSCRITDGDIAEVTTAAVKLSVVDSLEVPVAALPGLAGLAALLALAGVVRGRRRR